MRIAIKCMTVLCLLQLPAWVIAQAPAVKLDEPIIGKACPKFIFDNVAFYTKKQVVLADFRGKWLVMDFWDKNCSSCIGSFPRISLEQEELKDSVQFLMVTYLDKENEHQSMYAKYHNKLKLGMPCAFDHTGIFDRWNTITLPHIVIIDPEGIVRAITLSASTEQLRELIKGHHPDFIHATYADRRERKADYNYKRSLPFMVYENGGPDTGFLFRSLITQVKPGMVLTRTLNSGLIHSERENQALHNKGRFEQLTDMAGLYLTAYSGVSQTRYDSTLYSKFWPVAILDVENPKLFEGDYATNKGCYIYSLVVPPEKATKPFMMMMMQNDLKAYFGYDVTIEERKMPYWRLVATGEAKTKLKTIGGPRTELPKGHGHEDAGGTFRNMPIADFTNEVRYGSGAETSGIALLDETGIEGNIDIDVEWLFRNMDSVQNALRKNGLDVVKGEKLMKCIIIRDSKPITTQIVQEKNN